MDTIKLQIKYPLQISLIELMSKFLVNIFVNSINRK